MLLLNLATIRTAQQRVDQVYEPPALAAIDDRAAFVVGEPVRLGFDLFKDKDRFRLAGRVQTTLQLPCSRCLEAFAWPVDETFNLRFQPRGSDSAAVNRELGEDDFSVGFYDNDVIDLGQLMNEQFYLSMPMKALCAEGCLGLCAQCGANLNHGACGCVRDWDDPRFAALKALRHHSQES